MAALVSTKERDYLDSDPPLRGQRYACVSFLSPEDVLSDKDAFVFRRFMSFVGSDVGGMLDNLSAKFAADADATETLRLVRERHAYLWSDAEMQTEFASFRGANGTQLDEEFHGSAENNFRTSMRGLKIRGAYDDYDAAAARANAIKKFDDKFNVFVAEVGCWCPWSPHPDAIKDAEFAETQLNTLMKKYHENHENRDELYEARKNSMLVRMANEKEAWLENRKRELSAAAGADEGGSGEEVAAGGEAGAAAASAGGEEAAAGGEDGAASAAGGEEGASAGGDEGAAAGGEEGASAGEEGASAGEEGASAGGDEHEGAKENETVTETADGDKKGDVEEEEDDGVVV